MYTTEAPLGCAAGVYSHFGNGAIRRPLVMTIYAGRAPAK